MESGSVQIVLRTNISAYIGHHANNLIFDGKNKTRRDVDAAIKGGWSATHLSGFKIAAGTSIAIFVVEPIFPQILEVFMGASEKH